jgi:hypothetical protein
MANPPVLVPSAFTPGWRWAVRRRARSVAAGAGALTAGALVALWCTRAELPPPLPETTPATEKMVAATTTAMTATTAPRPVADPAHEVIRMAPVLREGRVRVLLRSEVDDKWLGGPGTLTEHDGLLVVTRPLGHAGRAEVARAIGAQVRLQRAGGGWCAAVVTGAVALARIDGGGEIDQDAGAEGVWQAADASRVIAGDLAIEGSCADALWASSASLPAPAAGAIAEAPAEVRRDAITALRARPEYKDMTDGSGSEAFEVSTLTTGGERVVVAKFLAETCTGQQPVLTGFWRAEAGGLHFMATEERVTGIPAAADVDGDGRMEILIEDDLLGAAVLRGESGRYRVEQRAPVDIRGCRC